MDQPATVDSHMEGVPVAEFREEISFFENPVIVQQHSIEDTTFHFQEEGEPSTSDLLFNH